jgi:trehalose/maltose hydrolase-like predicted phosphorylase
VLTSTGNGRFCARGTAEWQDADGVHYPGTYAHGVYNRETTILGGVPVLNEDLVNLPNWLVLKLRIEGGDAVRLADVHLLDYCHELDLRRAVLARRLRFRDADGRETTLRSRRFVSMAHPNRAGIEWTLTAENWSGRVEVIPAIDGRITNRGVERYQSSRAAPEAGSHVRPGGDRPEGQTRQSNVYVSQAACTRVFAARGPARGAQPLPNRGPHPAGFAFSTYACGAPVRIEKMVASPPRGQRHRATPPWAGIAARRGSNSREGRRAPRLRLGGAVAGL